uniref:Uncharacterized protein n=1 Tax=Arundo donax TaxID=35708 RepID=A0A0A9GYV7_ARUDO
MGFEWVRLALMCFLWFGFLQWRRR